MLTHVEVGRGRPIVLVPGMEGAHQYWGPQIEALGQRHRVVAFDLPVRWPRPGRTMADFAAEVRDLMDHLGIERATIMGASFGGSLALELALAYPERVDGLVLVSTLDRPRPVPLGANLFTVASAVVPVAFLPGVPRPLARRVLRLVGRCHGYVFDAAPGSDALVDYALDHGTRCGAPAFIDRALAALRCRYTERLEQVAVPTLVMRGAEDRINNPLAFEALARIPRVERVTVPGAGHCCQLTRSDVTTAAILGWLERQERQQRAVG